MELCGAMVACHSVDYQEGKSFFFQTKQHRLTIRQARRSAILAHTMEDQPSQRRATTARTPLAALARAGVEGAVQVINQRANPS